ncbi:SRPBCC family protein [Paenibacillus macerans]|uniref:SRPBCC family protein n=1 Tax=Paenibacillus macerans TaxID=44252 RepID=UPI003D317102
MDLNQVERSKLVITRILNAPRELVFRVWTDPAHFGKWWGPKESKLEVARMEANPGGTFLGKFTDPDGGVMWSKFVYREIAPPEKLAFIQSFSDEDGNTIRAPFDSRWPLEIMNILTLTQEEGDQTLLKLEVAPIDATDEELAVFEGMHPSMQEGYKGTIDQLADYLAAQQ